MSHAGDEQIGDDEVAEPHSMFAVEDDKPSPGGLANGLRKSSPHHAADKMRNAVGPKGAAADERYREWLSPHPCPSLTS